MFAVSAYDYSSPFTQIITYNGSNLPEYIAEAEPGTASSAIGWRIKKITYSGTNATNVQWARGNRLMDKIADNYASYTYT